MLDHMWYRYRYWSSQPVVIVYSSACMIMRKIHCVFFKKENVRHVFKILCFVCTLHLKNKQTSTGILKNQRRCFWCCISFSMYFFYTALYKRYSSFKARRIYSMQWAPLGLARSSCLAPIHFRPPITAGFWGSVHIHVPGLKLLLREMRI